ncbi:hypothetical protein AB205_0005780, partial [Aquarana catesbeiana]
GEQGDIGEKGEMGISGRRGLPGVDGIDGYGAPGKKAEKGHLGFPGYPGPQGDDGDPGSPGDQGPKGGRGRRVPCPHFRETGPRRITSAARPPSCSLAFCRASERAQHTLHMCSRDPAMEPKGYTAGLPYNGSGSTRPADVGGGMLFK